MTDDLKDAARGSAPNTAVRRYTDADLTHIQEECAEMLLPAPEGVGTSLLRDALTINRDLAGLLLASRAAITKACGIIELGDERLLASDGPAGGQPPDLNLQEWRELYVTLDEARTR